MIKTTNITKTVYNTHPSHSQPIRLYTPSTPSSSGSVCETDPSSISSSYRSNAGIPDDLSDIPQEESTVALIGVIEKLKRELSTLKQAKGQLAALYKVKCKSDLDKSAKISKLRLQFEYELHTFCRQDQKDLVCYLQRQLLSREQRISELIYDIEQLKSSEKSIGRTEPIQILRYNDPDLVISTVSTRVVLLRVLRRHCLYELPCAVLFLDGIADDSWQRLFLIRRHCLLFVYYPPWLHNVRCNYSSSFSTR